MSVPIDGMTRLLKEAKLPPPGEKTLSTLDLNRFAAPLRGQIASSCVASSWPEPRMSA